MVFQDFLLFPHRTVGENMVFPLRMQRRSRAEQSQQLDWVLDLLRLNGLEDRYPHQLSGGQQQRVALARGLIARPSVLLLDEPLANLDRELRKEMEIEVRRYQHELGIPFVYVTHNQEEALTMSDRIAVMRDGRFEQVGAQARRLHRAGDRLRRQLRRHANRLRGRASSSERRLREGRLGRTRPDQPSVRSLRAGGAGRSVPQVRADRSVATESSGRPTGADLINRLAGELRDVIFKGHIADCIVVMPQRPGAHRQRRRGHPGRHARRRGRHRLGAEAAALFPRRGRSERERRPALRPSLPAACCWPCPARCSSWCSCSCRSSRSSCSASGAPRATIISPTGTSTTTGPCSSRAPI